MLSVYRKHEAVPPNVVYFSTFCSQMTLNILTWSMLLSFLLFLSLLSSPSSLSSFNHLPSVTFPALSGLFYFFFTSPPLLTPCAPLSLLLFFFHLTPSCPSRHFSPLLSTSSPLFVLSPFIYLSVGLFSPPLICLEVLLRDNSSWSAVKDRVDGGAAAL